MKLVNLIKKNPLKLGATAALIIAVIIFASRGKTEPEKAATAPLPHEVTLIDLAHYANTGGDNSLVATPNAIVVHSEAQGRIVRIKGVGTSVATNEVIAELENSRERAQLTSAEGAYEAAVASRDITALGSAPSATGLASAQASARTAIGAAYSFLDDAIRNKTDLGYSDRMSDERRRFLVDDDDIEYSEFVSITSQRKAFNKIFAAAKTPTERAQDNSQLAIIIDEEQANLTSLQSYLADLTYAWNEATQRHDVSPELIASQKAIIAALRPAISQVQSQLAQAQSALASAELGKATSAKQSGASGTAAAQIKIAQGNLDLARAAYEKTLIRAPRSGKIVSESVHEGDVINPGTNIALIAQGSITALTGPTWSLPITAVKYGANGTFVYTVASSGVIVAHPVTTGLLTASTITVAGATATDMIIKDVRGLKEGELVTQAIPDTK